MSKLGEHSSVGLALLLLILLTWILSWGLSVSICKVGE